MSQHDLTIANQGFPAFRADLNDALQALGSCQSGTSAPSPTFANQLWYDTTNNILKIRNEDNDAWISIATLDQTADSVSVLSAATVNAGALNATGNTVLGDASTDTLNVGNGDLIKDASGIVGIGITPSAWGSFKAIQLGGATYNAIGSSNGYMGVFANTYFDGANFKYVSTAGASTYTQNGGAHYWSLATSGTAGNNITFTQAMNLAQDGNNTYLNFSGTGLADAVQLYTGYSGTSSYLAIGTKNSGTLAERMRINATGAVVLQGGSASANGTGIAFPSTQSASSDANTLDDYEEGSWTPSGATGFPAGGISTAIGTYTKIGNVVHVYGFMTAKTDGTTISIGGLPFATSYYEAVSISHETLTVRYARMLSAENNIRCIFSATQTAAFQEIFIQATYRV